MKCILMTIGLFSLFHTVLSVKCYYCNHPQFDFNDLQCTHPLQVDCLRGTVCAKNFNNQKKVKYCAVENTCQGDEFTVSENGVDY